MPAPTSRRDAIALAAICLSSLMFGLEISSVPTILPTLERVLHADFRQLQWIMNAYTIAVTSVLMATGTLADRYGRRRFFVGSILVFGLSSLICGMAGTAPLLSVARALQGGSGGAMLICQIAILSHQFRDGPARARAFAAWGIVFGAGLGFGPLVGSAIVAVADWRWVFLVHVPIALVTTGLTVGGVQESRDPNSTRLDLAGMVTLSLSVFCLAFYITQGPQLGFVSPTGLGIVGLAILSFVGFLIAETQSARPMFDFAVFRIPDFSRAMLGSMGMNFSFWPFMIYLPILLQSGFGLGNMETGIALLAYTLPTLVIPPLGERMLLRFGARTAIPAGLFTIGLGFMLMCLATGLPGGRLPLLLAGCLVAGIGLGLTNTPVTNTTTSAVPAARAGMASGMDMSARMISLAINIALMGLLLTAGIGLSLAKGLPDFDQAVLQHLAEAIAGGNLRSTGWPVVPADLQVRALIDGFRWVLLYGTATVWLLASSAFMLSSSHRSVECTAA